MADKITNFEDYKKRDNTEEIDIQIEDPYNFFNEQEREEYFQERQKELMEKTSVNEEEDTSHSEPGSDRESRGHRRPRRKHEESEAETCDEPYDDEEEYGDEEADEDEEQEEASGGFPIEAFIRISSVITGIVILIFLALFAKVKIYDRYFAKDPDEAAAVAQAIPAGFIEKNDTVVVTAQSLNLRTVPSSESDSTVVTAVAQGTELKRIAVNNEGTWALVEYNGTQVYASMKYLKEK